MKNILFISIAFPPKNDPECLQVAKYFKYLVRHKELTFTVATSSMPTLFMPYDAVLKKYDAGYVQKIEIPILEWKIANFLLRKFFPGGIDHPDSKFTFHWQLQSVIRKIKTKPDIIYSRSNPLSSTIFAYKAAKHFNVPWVLHLSDPWVDSPVKNYTTRQRTYHQDWENRCFTKASYVCLTSHHSIEFYKEKYPHLREKFLYFPNVYDAEDLTYHEIDFCEKLRIVYTGSLAGERTAENFLEACQQLLEDNPSLEKDFEVTFAGPLDRKNKKIIKSCGLKNVIHVGELAYSKAIELIKKSHLLLNIDLPVKNPAMAMFFASKILDYFLAGRKIISLTSRGSASASVLKYANAVILELDDIEGIKSFLKMAIAEYKAHNSNFFKLNFNAEEFNAGTNADRLTELFQSL